MPCMLPLTFTAATLAFSMLTLVGCQSKQSISENRQQEITRLQNQWNSVVATSMADCPTNRKTLEEPKTPKCLAEDQKAHEIEEKLKQLTAAQAAE